LRSNYEIYMEVAMHSLRGDGGHPRLTVEGRDLSNAAASWEFDRELVLSANLSHRWFQKGLLEADIQQN
jgi:hypothetical protein